MPLHLRLTPSNAGRASQKQFSPLYVQELFKTFPEQQRFPRRQFGMSGLPPELAHKRQRFELAI